MRATIEVRSTPFLSTLHLTPEDLAGLLRELTVKALDTLACRPTPSEAEAFGTFPFTYDQNHTEVGEMAPAFPAAHALAMLLPAAVRPAGRTMWMQATLVRSLRHATPLALQLFRARDAIMRSLQKHP